MASAFYLKDRQLGDEWKDWKGNLDSVQVSAASGKRVFLGLFLIWILLLGVAGLLFLYLISPRLLEIHKSLPGILSWILFACWGLVTLWFVFLILAILLKKHLFFQFRNTEICLTSLFPILQRLGKKLGLHPDKTGHSFVRVSNALIRMAGRRVHPSELLILLPRCLSPGIIEFIKKRAQSGNIRVFIVPGGELARQKIKEFRPKAVIGVACERDLISGICDIIPQIPVFGIPNMRPEGPCKNTRIHLSELEKAVEMFLGVRFSFDMSENQA